MLYSYSCYKNEEEIWGSEINLQLVQVSTALLNWRELQQREILIWPIVYSLYWINCGTGWWSNMICPEIHTLKALFKVAFSSMRYSVENCVEGLVAKGCNRDTDVNQSKSKSTCAGEGTKAPRWELTWEGAEAQAVLGPCCSLLPPVHAASSLVNITVCAARWSAGPQKPAQG